MPSLCASKADEYLDCSLLVYYLSIFIALCKISLGVDSTLTTARTDYRRKVLLFISFTSLSSSPIPFRKCTASHPSAKFLFFASVHPTSVAGPFQLLRF